MFQVTVPNGVREERPYDLVGPLCTSIDTLGHGVKLLGPIPGDVIAVRCSGAYGLTASPVHFISHEPARELLVEGDEDAPRVTDVSQLQSVCQTQMNSQDVLFGS
jgi:diaminopimelate decarboxylase